LNYNIIIYFVFKDREFVEMGPDALMSSSGGASLIPGGSAIAGLGRFSSPASNFLLNRRKWWCCGGRRRRKNSYKINIVSFRSTNTII
jgi:hypothetical protein